MDLNLTLLGQMITFAIFVWFTMKFVFPPILKAMQARKDKIVAGLAAAEQGERAFDEAQIRIRKELAEAREQAGHIIAGANQRAAHIVEAAKTQARDEGERLLLQAHKDIDLEYQALKRKLVKQVSSLAVVGAEHILRHEVDQASNDRLVADLVKEI